MPDDAAGENDVGVVTAAQSRSVEATGPSGVESSSSKQDIAGDGEPGDGLQGATWRDLSHKPPDKSLAGERRPPLPPRPSNLALLKDGGLVSPTHATGSQQAPGPSLQSTATTAVAHTKISTQSFQDGTVETSASTTEPKRSVKSASIFGSVRKFRGLAGNEQDDTASIKSSAPTLSKGDDESFLEDPFGATQSIPTWELFNKQNDASQTAATVSFEEDEIGVDFCHEFDAIPSAQADGQDEEQLLVQWKSRRKHFLILSSAGKPIYTRHGDDSLVSSSISVVLTIISFFEDSKDRLTGFTAGGTRFVVMSQGPLYLVAISRLGESDPQLRSQLEALYMQILSTLTLPTLNQLFVNRPSTDLRRPLKGTEVLLSTLADSFTRGSSSALLSALECLRMKKSQRTAINEVLLRHRCASLLYGLLVAGGRLVSVARPRKHSLHPSDLQLIFNMLFEADGIKEGGGENWIPICLPGFNKNGYLYMYVSFVSTSEQAVDKADELAPDSRDAVVVILISANKESFYDLRDMRNSVVRDLEENGSMEVVRSLLRVGRFSTTDMVPGTVLRHFLYKSKANVQFLMPSYEPEYATLLAHRRLLSLYHTIHADMHSKNAHLKLQHCVSLHSTCLGWTTPLFELYCVAGPNVSRTALAQGANRVVQWVRREEERIFIVGGAVF